MTPAQMQAFQRAAMPLIEYLRDNLHPHYTVLVDSDRAVLLEAAASVKVEG